MEIMDLESGRLGHFFCDYEREESVGCASGKLIFFQYANNMIFTVNERQIDGIIEKLKELRNILSANNECL